MTGTIVDISKGGVAIAVPATGRCGLDAAVLLPGAGEPVPARVIRADGTNAALAFRQDDATLKQVRDSPRLIGPARDREAA